LLIITSILLLILQVSSEMLTVTSVGDGNGVGDGDILQYW